MTTRTEPRTAAAHVPPTPPPPPPAGMALTELLAALEGERRTHAAATRAGQTRQDNTTMREPTTPTAPGEMLGERSDRHPFDAAARTEPQEAPAPAPRFAGESTLDQELGALKQFHVIDTVNHLRDLAYATAVAAGWHDTRVIEGVRRQASAGERVALIHEEATELLAHIREGDLTSDGAGIELADIVIRCLDYAGRYEIDLGRLIATKMRHNRTRTHRHGGKVL